MDWRRYAVLAVLGLALALAVAQFQPFPGYLDSDYYFGGGIQLASGKGFIEPYLWNYLDDPQGLPHPSHTYWMPLASIIAAAGLWITGSESYEAGRLGFLLLAAFVPVVTAALACTLTQRRDLAFISGLLAVFAVYYVPFLPVPDNYGPYLILGGTYFLLMSWRKPAAYLALGAVSGLMALARSDGLLWLGLTGVLIVARLVANRKLGAAVAGGLLVLAGFLLVAGPWFLHTYSTYGTPLAPGGGYLLWLRNYDDTFAYPASQLTMQRWLAQGWQPILAARLMALRWNLLNTFAAQGEIFLLPFLILGLWIYRREERVRLALFGWFCLLLIMTLVFPFAGARGGFFHAGAAFQPLWWALAPAGLDRAIAAARRRGMFTPQASRVFQGALVGLVVLMTGVILAIRVIPHWGEGEDRYPAIEAFLQTEGIASGEVVMVRNPPGYYLMTGRPAIVVPYSDEASIAAAARRYGARYLVLEAAGAAGPIKDVYERRSSEQFIFVSDIDGTRIFRLAP
jgi:hypothetical protein